VAREPTSGRIARAVAGVGETTVRGVEDVGLGGSILGESLYWIFLGRRRRQPVRMPSIFAQMMDVGIHAIPIVTVLAGTVGVMLALQGIDTLRTFGAESQVVLGIALSVTREFAPLITGILVAGRSGSALAARLASMTLSQEIDALRVIGVNPIRFLVAPALLAMLVMVPALTFWSDLAACGAGGLWVSHALGMSMRVYFNRTIEVLDPSDVMHGIAKSAIFAVLITVIGVVNGATVTGGAEGVGRVTTRAVVQAISAIVIADMIFVYLTLR
jgi:phospholipid/cholesterol/gamma-HCH transport system permease protein